MTKNIDVDKTWDPEKGTLHDHRMTEFEKLKQAGFATVKAKPKAAQPKPTGTTTTEN